MRRGFPLCVNKGLVLLVITLPSDLFAFTCVLRCACDMQISTRHWNKKIGKSITLIDKGE
jgi:hypothetical protein